MMHFVDPYAADREMNLRVDEELRRAEARGLRRLAGPGPANPLIRRGRWLLCELGYLLVALGARLEDYALAQ